MEMKTKVRVLDLGVIFALKTRSKTSNLHLRHNLLSHDSITVHLMENSAGKASQRDFYPQSPVLCSQAGLPLEISYLWVSASAFSKARLCFSSQSNS